MERSKSDRDIFYAGFWKRVAANLIDTCILMILNIIFVSIGITIAIYAGDDMGPRIIGVALFMAVVVNSWIYWAVMERSSRQATLGKIFFGIKVTDLNGDRISFAKATGRYFGKIISTILFNFGFLMAAFTKKHQALHDMMTGCLVVNIKKQGV